MDKTILPALLSLCSVTVFICCSNATMYPITADCSSLPIKNNGFWWCDDNKISCNLNCNTGYASLFSTTICTNGAWTDLDKMECSPSVIILLGGERDDWRDETIEIYHPTTHNLKCSNSPPKIDLVWKAHSTFLHNGLVYMCYNYVCKILNLTDQSAQWKNHDISSIRKYDHSTVVIQNTVYFIGGVNRDKEYVESVWTTLPLKNKPVFTTVPNLPYRGWNHCVIKISQDSFVITGGDNSGSTKSVTKYNVTERRSTVLPPLQEGRFDHGCILVEEAGKQWIVVTGGVGAGGYEGILTSTERLDLNGGTQWESLGQLNVQRAGHGMIQTDKGIMVIGGLLAVHNGLKSVEMLHWSSGKWKIDEHSLKSGRYGFGQALEVPASIFNCDMNNKLV